MEKIDEKQFQIILNSLADEIYKDKLENKKKNWTNLIKKKFSEYGSSLGYEVMVSKTERNKSEWLFDMVWFASKNGHIDHVYLVLESEFEPRIYNIIEDFNKLLVARAEVRVMIFARRKTYQVEETFRDIEERIKSFSQTMRGDTYFLYGLSWSDGAFHEQIIRA
jgi:hypothetical protein